MIGDAAHRSDISEDAILALQHCGLTGRLLPTPHDNIGICGINLQQHGPTPCALSLHDESRRNRVGESPLIHNGRFSL